MATKEQDVRLKILNSLLDSTHREVSRIVYTHKTMMSQDPLFYGHLAVWAQENTEIRDHKEVFVANLLLSEFPEHREAGYVLLQNFPPHQIVKIKNHVKELFKKNPPRIMKSAVKEYLMALEKNEARFDGAAASKQKKALIGLYSSFRLKPGMTQTEDAPVVIDGRHCIVTRAQAILFEKQPPVGSKPYQVKVLAATEDPVEQAKLIVEHRIPYTTAVGAIKNMTPSVLAALINQMTDQELLVNLGSLKTRGALDNADIKELINNKLAKIKKSKKVDALKAAKAAETAGVDAETAEKLVDISDAQLKGRGRITMGTALIIDKSSSMTQAIEVGKRIGSMISAIVESDFYCWAFDNVATQINVRSDKLKDWENALKMVRAGGCTSCGAPLWQMAERGQHVEQIVMITDQGENRPPYFRAALDKWKEKFGSLPRIIIVNVGDYNRRVLEERCRNNQVECEAFDVPNTSDYYSLPNLIPLLTRRGRLELLDDIMQTSLPTKEEFKKKMVRLIK